MPVLLHQTIGGVSIVVQQEDAHITKARKDYAFFGVYLDADGKPEVDPTLLPARDENAPGAS